MGTGVPLGTLEFPMQGAWVLSLVRELDATCLLQLGFCMPQNKEKSVQ